MSDTQETTQELLDGRQATYGDRVKNMTSLSDMINGYMDGVEQRSGKRDFGPQDVAMMMVLTKAYRFAVAPDYGDNIADIFGYAEIAKECVGDRMIEAGSAQEYQAIKESRRKRPGKDTSSPQYHAVQDMLEAGERGYHDVTLEEAREVIRKDARRVNVPPINLGEQPDVPSAIIPTKRELHERAVAMEHMKAKPIVELQQGTPEYDSAAEAFLRDAELAGQKIAAELRDRPIGKIKVTNLNQVQLPGQGEE